MNKRMYKLELLCVKYVPIIIAAIVLLNAILARFDVYVDELNYIAGTSFLTLIPMYITVSKMFHTEGGRKYVGEKFDMLKAKEICERYRGIIPQSATHGDVYVAINAQYHDYCELFKAWFGDSVDSKIIESAINFWFKDDDFKEGCKVWKYFNMM